MCVFSELHNQLQSQQNYFCFFTKDKTVQILEKFGYEFNVMGQSSGSKYAHISLWDSNDVFLDDFSTLDALNSQGSVTTETCFS